MTEDTAIGAGSDGTISVECLLEAPPETIWRALSRPELAAEWLSPDCDAAQRRPPEIVSAEPCRRIVYRWSEDGSATPSTIAIELEAADGATLLRVLHHPPAALRAPANGNAPARALAA